MARWKVGFAALIVALLAGSIVSPDQKSVVRADDPIPPHLGYGIHIAPNTNVNPALVDQLGMDWVKIYDPGQVSAFPGKRILFRMDLRWPGDWNVFKTDVANRARDLGGLKVAAIEIGNEPNLINEWGHTPNAWEYVQLLRVAYTTIKAVNPDVIIVSAGLAPTLTTKDRGAINDLDYAREMLENGAGQWFDAFGYHPYGYNLPPDADPVKNQLVFRRTERIRALMEKYGVYKQIWLTEFGWLRDPAEDGVNCSDNDPDFSGFAWLRVSGEKQATYLVQAFQYAHENWPWAGPTFVWNLNWQLQTWLNACNHQRWFGLLKANGEPTLAFRRLQAMEHHYSDYQPHLSLQGDPMVVNVSLACLQRIPLGQFKIVNSGYPIAEPLSVQAVNGIDPPYVTVKPTTARVGDTVNVTIDPIGMRDPGQYTVYVNVKTMVEGKPVSQSTQGTIIATQSADVCH